MCWIWLSLAIALEVAATVFMKLSNGFTRVVPTVSMFVFYVLSLVPMVAALKQMEVSAVYAIWSAVGTAMVATLGIFLFDEPASALKVASIGLIIVGVVCLNLSMRHPSAPNLAARHSAEKDSRTESLGLRHDAASAVVPPVLVSRDTSRATLR
jgi:small multidrug resistance pump